MNQRTCPECGKKFEPCYKQQVCCGYSCSGIRKARLRGLRMNRDAVNQRKKRAERMAKKSEMELRRERLAARDADYAESPCAAPVTVETRGNRVIETRGRCCLGWRSCGHVSHNG